MERSKRPLCQNHTISSCSYAAYWRLFNGRLNRPPSPPSLVVYQGEHIQTALENNEYCRFYPSVNRFWPKVGIEEGVLVNIGQHPPKYGERTYISSGGREVDLLPYRRFYAALVLQQVRPCRAHRPPPFFGSCWLGFVRPMNSSARCLLHLTCPWFTVVICVVWRATTAVVPVDGAARCFVSPAWWVVRVTLKL